MTVRPDSLPIVCLLTALVAVGPVSTDLYLPALPAIAETFGADSGRVQLTLSVFMAGFAASQLIYGPLSDRFGRRPLLIAGMALYIVASVLCAVAPSVDWLIAARFLQALGGCVGPVLGRAIVRDVFGLDRAAQVMSYMALAMAVAPAVGPAVGGYVQVWAGWQATFAVLAGFGVLLLIGVSALLPETNAYKNPQATRPGRLLAAYGQLAADPAYRGYVVIQTATFSGIFAFISGSSFVLVGAVGLSPDQFGLCFAAIVVGFMIGTFVSGRLTRRLGLDRMIRVGLALGLAGGVPMALLAFAAPPGVLAIVAPMALFMVGTGLVLPNAMAGAIGPFPRMAGTASALMGFVQMGTAALVGVAVGQLADGTARAMAGAVGIAAVVAALGYLRLARLRRVAQPAA